MELNQTQNDTTKAANRYDIHQEVTNAIIEQLEAGTAPWHRPWTGGDSMPFRLPVNGKSSKAYEGINILLLWGAARKQQFVSNEWATFKDWNAKKESIRAGETHSAKVVWFQMLEKEVDGEIQKIPFMKYSPVFNRCQLKSYNPETELQPEIKPLIERLDNVERFVANTQAVIKHTGYRACFVPDKDEIYMPHQSSFIDTEQSTATENYYSTLMHELTHWTGHPIRLERKFGKKFGDNTYAGEELIAELGAAFLCAEFEITNTLKPDHANYLAHWLGILKENKYAITGAASFASKAIDYLHWLQP